MKNANGILTWALILSGQPVRAPVMTGVWAFPWQETGTILANLPGVLAQMTVQPGAVIVECGTNNVYHNAASGTLEAITADWTAIATLLAGRGIRTNFVPILPRIGGGSHFSTVFSNAQHTSSIAAIAG